MPSQLPYPGTHVIPHVPEVHVAIVLGAVAPGQAPPHTPQLCGSVINVTSQPFEAEPSQLA
jgi:hypothetical protein